MRHRSPLGVGLAFLLLQVLVTVQVAEAHPFHLQIANDVIAGSEVVRDDRWLAQSFVPATDFVLTRVSLYVIDTGGSDVLFVSVRDDAGGTPAGSNLTYGGTDTPAVDAWADFAMGTDVPLLAGQTYWIVARSVKGGSAGYEWWSSASDAVYPNGTGIESPDETVWTSLGSDLTFRVYGFTQPGISFGVSASVNTAGPGDSVVFRANFTNTGAGEAEDLWVNVTMPAEVNYLSDDAATIGGVLSGTYSFRFQMVAPGAYSFNLTGAVTTGAVNGTVATARFTMNATDHLGAIVASGIQDVTVTLENAAMDLALTSSASTAEPGDSITLNATLTNVGMRTAQNLIVRAVVPPTATYISSFPPGTYDAFERNVTWTPSSLPPGARTNLSWTLEVLPGTADGTTIPMRVRLDYGDPTGTPMEYQEASALVLVNAPAISPALVLDRFDAEHGDEVFATLFYNNTGSVTASSFRANWSMGGHYELLELTPAVSSTPSIGGFDLLMSDVGPGSHSVTARLRVVRGLMDGLDMALRVSWTATDGNGNPLPGGNLGASVDLLAPAFVLDLAAEGPTVELGDVFSLDLLIRNDGRASGLGWLNLSLPPGMTYLSDNGTLTPTVSDGEVSWLLPPVSGGAILPLGVRLRMDGAAGTQDLHFVMNLTDEADISPEQVLSNVVSVEFRAEAGWPWWSFVILAVVLSGILAAALMRSRSTLSIEEVFVVHRKGALLAHRSKTLTPNQDEDVLAAMLTAVESFVADAFSEHEAAPMRSIEFGEYTILVEPGSRHSVAVVYRGEDDGSLEGRLSLLVQRIDEEYGETLAKWSGDVAEVRGIRGLLPTLWGETGPDTRETE